MKHFCLSLLLFFSVCLLNAQIVNIIPRPVSLQVKEGYFTIDANTSFKFIANKDLQDATTFFAGSIRDISGYSILSNKASAKTIELKIDKNKVPQAEGYQLSVSPARIIVIANRREGILFGLQSILQTLPAIRTNAALQVPAMEIVDYPQFKYRGMHLDVSRHFFSPETVKMYIDLIAKYKRNTFHWH